MSSSAAFDRNQLRQLILTHSREAMRDRRGMVTMLVVFGGLLIGLAVLDLLIAWNNDSQPHGTSKGSGVLASSLPMIALIGFSSLALVNTAVPLAAYRAKNILRHLGTTPVSRGLFIVAHVPVRIGLGLLQVATLLILAVLFATPTPAASLRAALLMFSAMLAFLALGYLLGALLRDPDRALNLSFILTIVLIATSGTALPLESLPDMAGSVLSWLPTTQFVLGLRAELLGTGTAGLPFWAIVSLLLGIAVALLAVASRIFRWEAPSQS
ncbi:MAG: ABC transporter permease [Glutamicibacter ardleyensis]